MLTMGRSPPGLGTKRSLESSSAGRASCSSLTSASDSSRSRTLWKCCLAEGRGDTGEGHAGTGRPARRVRRLRHPPAARLLQPPPQQSPGHHGTPG